MRTLLLLACAVVACAVVACGQAAFEVAAIKPGGSTFSTSPQISAGRLRWTTDLFYLVAYAYDLDFSQVSGVQRFPDSPSGVYAMEAVFDPSANGSQVREMLRTLLAERFQMQAHMATQEADGYALVVGPGGFKGVVATDDVAPFLASTLPQRGLVQVNAQGASITELVRNLQRSLRQPVWDRTGLTGRYNFEFQYAGDAPADVDAPWIGTALEESLGLRLERQKGPKQTLVIDRLAPPSEN